MFHESVSVNMAVSVTYQPPYLCSSLQGSELTRATTAINSDHPEGSPTTPWCRAVLTSSSTMATSLIMLLAAS